MTIHQEKSAADEENRLKKREELEAFKNAESQEVPAAERLESIARLEISRSIDDLETIGKDMDRARVEFEDIKAEFDLISDKCEFEKVNLKE
jgi:hypothetical protein